MDGRSSYRNLTEISTGERFRVFRAERVDDRRSVVLKTVRADRREPRNEELLRHEWKILLGLDHPGVARPLALEELDEGPVLVLEDAGPRNVYELLGGGPLDLPRFLELASSMAEIVAEVHRQGIIHRDICPSNFVLGDGATLVDLEAATATPAFTQAPGPPGELEGTLAYIAPEQTGRMNRRVDHRADLYALGATFYEMLTGAPPFPSRDPLELLHAHAARCPPTPAVVNGAVPGAVSNIVVKLLAKMPEWRYQSADALKIDLEEARRRWRSTGEIPSFELGLHDVPYGLLISGNLYGRERAQETLQRILERVSAAPAEVVLVTGPAGIGKSALLHHVRDRAGAECRWLEGKGDLLAGNVPHAPVLEAFRGLLRDVLRQPAEQTAGLRERLRAEVAPNGRVLTDRLPELEQLIGEQPGLADVGPVEAENRFERAFVALVRALTGDATRHVLFVDDLQWADPASTKLVSALAAEPGLRSLLIVGAYRTEELAADHPLWAAARRIRAAGTPLTTLELESLEPTSIIALLCEALRIEPDEAAPLAETIAKKTAGNPFFVRQFLGHLYRAGLLVYDPGSGRWSWDLTRIDGAQIGENVVELLSRNIGRLPAREQDVLETAACVGNEFGLGLVAAVRGETLDEVARSLWAPIQQGLLVPVVGGPRFPWTGGKPVELGTAHAPAYRFAHDRLQEAVYRLIGEERREELHLRIGRWLLAHAPPAAFEDAICSIVDQLDRAAEHLVGEERLRLATLNYRAGRLARAATAWASGLGYFTAGLELLPPQPWGSSARELWFAMVRDAAECAALTGDYALCEALAEGALPRTERRLEKAALWHVLAQSSALRGDHAVSIERSAEGLRLLGVDLPREVSEAVMETERARTREALRGRSDRQLLEAPTMEDEEERARLRLLVGLAAATWFTAPRLFQVVCRRAVALTAGRGVAADSAFAFATYAIALAMEGEYEEAHRFGRLGVALAERSSNAAQECRALMVLGGHVSPWRAPLRDAIPLLRRAYARGLESGELEYAAYAVANLLFALWSRGASLDAVLAEADSALAFYRRIGHLGGIPYVAPFTQAARCLKGLTRGHACFDDARFDESRFVLDAAGNGLGLAVYHLLRLQTSYLLDEPALAIEHARRGERWLPHLRTIFLQADHFLYTALALSSLYDEAPAAAREGLLSELRSHHHRLERWARESPATFGHKCDLVAAEIARIERRPETGELYERAIARASGEGLVHEAALDHERCARFLAAHGELEGSELHHRAAVEGYAAWGAGAKVALLAKEHPSGSTTIARSAPASPGRARSLQTLELRILLQAAEALSSELDLERLLRKLMRTAVEAASAERAALVLAEQVPSVRAVATAQGEVTLHDIPLSESAAVPATVVQHVLRSGADLVIKDALADDRFARDPYVARNGVRSVLAVPLRRQDRTVGILYFENDLATDAFTPDRVEVFRLLSAQMAVALENSLLFAERRRAEEALNLLARAGGELSKSLDYEQVLATVGTFAVPALADWCIVDVLEGRALVPAGQWHADPSKQPLLEKLRRLVPIDVDSPRPQAQALRSREPQLVTDVTPDFLRAGVRDEEHLRLVQALDPRSLIVVPLVGRGRAIGVLTLVRCRPERRYGEAELSLAQQFARRVALAVDNARLHRALQEAMRLGAERDRYLRMTFRQVPGVFWATDRSLRLTHIAGNVLDAPDLDARKLLGSSVQDFAGARDPTEPAVAHHLAALAGEPQSFQYRHRDRWYEVLIEPLRDPERAIVGCVGAAFDVTERRATAERLARSEARFAEAQRVAHIGSFEWDVARNVVTWSDELHRIYGLEPGQFTGRYESFLDRVHPEDLELTKTAVFEAYREVKPFVYDHRVIRADGSVRMLHTRGDVVADEQGRPVRVVGSCWDVTELKESIRKLEHAVSRWEATLEATAEGILVVDLEGNISAVNHRFLSLWRIPAEGAHARKHLDMLAPVLDHVEDPRAFLERVREIYADPAQESFDVVRFKDGRVFERQSTPQHIGEENVGRVWSIRDVTERERLLRRALLLADASRLLASLEVEPALDSVAHLAVPFLGDGCAVDLLAEGGPRRLLAVSRDPTRPINPQLHPSVVAGHPTLYELEARSYMAVPLLVKGALVGAMTFVAPPARRYTSDDLELAEELARRAALSVENARLYRGAQDALRARDEFLSIAAHEIRGPITSMHLAVQGLQRGKIPPAAMAKVLDVIEREDRRLARFVDELLDLGRLRGDRLHLTYEHVDLGDVVREAASRLGAELAESGSSLSIATEGRAVGQWDRFRLDQVVTNLLSNAIKFGLGKPIAISVKAERGNVMLAVKDQGIGISPDVRERIFRPFERAVAVRHYGGLGLGLFIARTVVEELGGKISVESTPNAGSLFTVELPRARVG